MRNLRIIFFLIVVTIQFSSAIFAQPVQSTPTDAEISARVSEYLQPLIDSKELSGTLLIGRGSKVVFEKSYGMANYELGVLNTPKTRFCIASVSKPITYIILLKLLEAGKLDLKDPISKWFPDFPRGAEITVEHLASHSSGLPHRVTTDAEEVEAHTAADMVEFAKRAKLIHEPGSQSGYSSAGYSVLSRVLELAAGKSFEQLLLEIVLAPVGATQTVHPYGRSLLPDRAAGYFRGVDSPINAPFQDLSFLVGAGSLFSTPSDLHKIAQGVINGTYGSQCKEKMIRKEGLRWAGYTNGYRAFVNYYIDTDIYVIFAGNLFTGAGNFVNTGVSAIVSGEKIELPSVPRVTPMALSASDRKKFEGTYQLSPGQNEELRFQGSNWATLGDWILIPNGSNSFYSPQDYNFVQAVNGSNGSVDALQWGEPGQGPRFAKIK
jgi:CubicO group peptidase (beta-lactamase class C family)